MKVAILSKPNHPELSALVPRLLQWLGDHKYVVITLIVLALLCWSLFASR